MSSPMNRQKFAAAGRVNRFRLALWLIVLAVAVTSIAPFAAISGMAPDMFLLFVVVISLKGRKERALTTAWITGLAKDLLSEGPLGLYAALFVAAAWALLNVRSFLSVDMLKVQMFLGAMAAFSVNLLYIAVNILYNPVMGVVETLGRLAAAVVMTALLTPVFNLLAGGAAESLNIAEQRPQPY